MKGVIGYNDDTANSDGRPELVLEIKHCHHLIELLIQVHSGGYGRQ